MAVGTGAISLSEVIAEMAGTQTSLQDCIDDHKPAGLNSTYYTAPLDSLADFRGYDDSAAITYYRLIGCGGLANTYTTNVPAIANQRYINASIPTNYYYWNNTSTTTTQTIIGSLQKVSGQTNCP